MRSHIAELMSCVLYARPHEDRGIAADPQL
jgi:hypothetical protein